MPVATTRFVPNRSTSLADRGAITMTASANGMVCTPAESGL